MCPGSGPRRHVAGSLPPSLPRWRSRPSPRAGRVLLGEEPAPNKIVEGQAPDYYPADYATKVIDASKDEGGELTIYSNTAEENWAPIFRDFQKKYPWVEKLSANDLDSDEVFQKVLSEQSTGSSPVDMMVSNASAAWATFLGRPDTLMDYESPELTELPDFAQLLPNVYAMSADPMTIAYNTALMEKAPTGIKSLADIAEADPDTYDGKITVRDPESSFGFTVTRAFTEANPDGWSDLERLLPMTKPETSSGTQLEARLGGVPGRLLHQRWARLPGRRGQRRTRRRRLPRGRHHRPAARHRHRLRRPAPRHGQALPRLRALRGGQRARGRRGWPVVVPRRHRGPGPAHLPGARRGSRVRTRSSSPSTRRSPTPRSTSS